MLKIPHSHSTFQWSDLSLGAPPALCCAPLVEEVLVYCLHDLVNIFYIKKINYNTHDYYYSVVLRDSVIL